MIQPMKVSTASMPSIKSVHDGSQSNSQNCTKRSIWTSANSFWIAMVLKVTTSWKESSLEMKLGPIITNQRVNTRVWIGNIRHSPTKKKFKTHSTTGKLMLTVFGTLWRDWCNNEQCSLQCDELKPTIWSQWRGLLSESTVLLHDNACPHTVETLKKLNFEVLEHPLYRLDLTPSDSPVWSA